MIHAAYSPIFFKNSSISSLTEIYVKRFEARCENFSSVLELEAEKVIRCDFNNGTKSNFLNQIRFYMLLVSLCAVLVTMMKQQHKARVVAFSNAGLKNKIGQKRLKHFAVSMFSQRSYKRSATYSLLSVWTPALINHKSFKFALNHQPIFHTMKRLKDVLDFTSHHYVHLLH